MEIFGGRSYQWNQRYCAVDEDGKSTCWGNSACDLPTDVRYVHIGISSDGICGIDDEDVALLWESVCGSKLLYKQRPK